MDNIKFDWDESKAILNKKKHGISFEEAVTRIISARKATKHEAEIYWEEKR